MQIRIESRETAVRLMLSGRLDASWADHLVETVAAQVREGRHAIELELSEVEFLSSAGIRALLRAQRQVAAVRGSYALLSPGPLVHSVLKTAGLLALVKSASAPQQAEADRETTRRAGGCEWTGAWNSSARAARVGVHGSTGDANAPAAPVDCGRDDLVVGIGALGADAGAAARAGEFLAAAGLAAAMPTDGARLPDYVAAPGGAAAAASLVHALRAQGGEAQILRFEALEAEGAPLSGVLSGLLDSTGSDAVACALLAESAELVGAGLLKSPLAAGRDPYAWPQVRDNLGCTTERSGERRTALVVAFAARTGGPAAARLASQLRPHGVHGVQAHAHALVFPYRALPRRQGALRATLDEQLAAGQPLALLHLLHDDRDDGLGESLFLRGTAWVLRADTEVQA